ncbi:TPA: 2OG-Fe(II) oxygenase [Vibrio diabolicus]
MNTPVAIIPHTRKIEIQGLPVFVFDGLISPEAIQDTYQHLLNRRYECDHASSKSTKKYREWVSEINLQAFQNKAIYSTMNQLIQQCFPQETISCFSVFCNCISYGCHTFIHQDGGAKCYSALYYANPEWHEDWGGETTLFNDQEDAVVCIAPVPGRIIVLDGRVVHRAGVPSRACPVRRYTVSLRSDSKELTGLSESNFAVTGGDS